MRICRFSSKSKPTEPRLGVMDEAGVRDVTAVTDSLPSLRWPLPQGDQLIANLSTLLPKMRDVAAEAEVLPLDSVKLLAPVANPGKFICGVGNWKHHKAPLGMMGFLFKMTSAQAGAGDGVQIRWPDRITLHEPELAIVIGREVTNVSEAEALNYVAGYTCALDMTMKEEREFFTFCKSFDSYGVLGPCLLTADAAPTPSAFSYKFWVNGELRGERNFADLTGSPAQLVAFASTVMTLHPGDVIFSGAADVGPVMPGDVMSLEIPEIGRMDVPVSVCQHARNVNAKKTEEAKP